jgi:hypothetical protein
MLRRTITGSMQSLLATGHPAIPTGDFDFTPLLYTGLLLLGLRRARVPFRIWVLPVAIVAGGLIDSISDGLRFSTPTSAAVLALVVLLNPLRWPSAYPLPPPDV